MDLGTLLGLLIAWGALAASLMIEGGKVSEMFNLSALVLVVFGTIGATLIGSSIKTVVRIPAILISAIKEPDLEPGQIIDIVVSFARTARTSGMLSLDNRLKDISNRFLRKGFELIIDGVPSVMVRDILETEVAALQERHKAGEVMFSSLGGFSPTLGIIGTVMGLINMLARLNEPGKMGHSIAAAFIATLYGVALANLLYLPIAGKLKSRTSEEVLAYEMIIEGVLAIQAGEGPRMVESRMMAFLSPSQRLARGLDNPTSASDRRIAC